MKFVSISQVIFQDTNATREIFEFVITEFKIRKFTHHFYVYQHSIFKKQLAIKITVIKINQEKKKSKDKHSSYSTSEYLKFVSISQVIFQDTNATKEIFEFVITELKIDH